MYEVCVYVEDPPRYMKFYSTLKDYHRCNAAKIVILGSSSPKTIELYERIREIHEDVEIELIDESKDSSRAEELLMICKNARHLIILEGGYIK